MTSNLNKQSMDDYKRNTLNYMKMSNILKYWHWMQHVYTYIKINESHCTEKKRHDARVCRLVSNGNSQKDL